MLRPKPYHKSTRLLIKIRLFHISRGTRINNFLCSNTHCLNQSSTKQFITLVRVQHHHLACVDTLLSAGADVNIQANNGATALMLAVQFGFYVPSLCVFPVGPHRKSYQGIR